MKQIFSGTPKKFGITKQTHFIYLIIKIFLLITILTATNAQALDFTFQSPEEIKTEESFKISIETEEEITEKYDVKIFVTDDNKAFSEIEFNGNWNSPYYYLKETFPKYKEYEIIAHQQGETYICARLRKTGQSNFDEICNEILVLKSEEFKNNEEDANRETEEKLNKKIISDNQDETNPADNNQLSSAALSEAVNNQESIVLNNPSEQKEIISTKSNSLRLGIIYTFTIFSVIIIILLVLRKL